MFIYGENTWLTRKITGKRKFISAYFEGFNAYSRTFSAYLHVYFGLFLVYVIRTLLINIIYWKIISAAEITKEDLKLLSKFQLILQQQTSMYRILYASKTVRKILVL